MLRAPAWPESQLLPQLLALLPPANGGGSGGGAPPSLQHLAGQLHLMTALAEATCSRDVSMHPQRRDAARAALAATPELLPTVQQALALGGSDPSLPAAALQLLQAWCALGAPPAGAEGPGAAQLWRQLHQAVLHPGMGSAAAEALAALYASCCAPEAGADDPQLTARRQQMLACLLGLLPGFAAELEAALRSTHSAQAQAQLLFAALTLLGAAAAAADSPHDWDGTPGLQPATVQAVTLAAEAALAALKHPVFDVTLAALQHWDEQLERWKAQQQQQQGACSPEQRAALLGRLCGGLLQRMVLPAHLPPPCTTADARDLPDEVQQVGLQSAWHEWGLGSRLLLVCVRGCLACACVYTRFGSGDHVPSGPSAPSHSDDSGAPRGK